MHIGRKRGRNQRASSENTQMWGRGVKEKELRKIPWEDDSKLSLQGHAGDRQVQESNQGPSVIFR